MIENCVDLLAPCCSSSALPCFFASLSCQPFNEDVKIEMSKCLIKRATVDYTTVSVINVMDIFLSELKNQCSIPTSTLSSVSIMCVACLVSL